MLTPKQIRDALRQSGLANTHWSWVDEVLTDGVIEFIQRDAQGIETAEDIAIRRRNLEGYKF